MKIPRGCGGAELVAALHKFGYSVVRQTGSHIRLTNTSRGFEHNITVPDHSPLKIGTLNSILSDVASYLQMDKQALMQQLFN